MIRALIFDFDGLIRDTESAEFEAWRAVYEAHGAELPLERWVLCIGTRGGFDPFAYLEEQVGRSMDRGVARAEQRAQMRRLMEGRGAMAGVEEWVKAARDRGLGLAVASSSDRGEVVRQLEELGLRKHFGPVCGGDEVPVVKPDPALYRLALERLGVRAEEAVALEDSANGVRAAKRAGLRCVAVPNRITAGLDFSEADLKVASLAAFTLDDLFRRFETTVPTKP